MSQGTRLLLFHEDGELKQIWFPRLSPLWFLASLSFLALLTLVLMALNMRLYHEKRDILSRLETLEARSAMSEAVVQSETRTAMPVNPGAPTVLDSLRAMLTTSGSENFDAPDSPLELVVARDAGVTDEPGRFVVDFQIRARRTLPDAVEGRVCGLFLSANTAHFLPNEKTRESWLSMKDPTFDRGGPNCDSFRIKITKPYNVKLSEPLVSGMIHVYSNEGRLLHYYNWKQ